MGTPLEHQRVLAITPFAEPSAHLAAALARAGARSVLDLGSDPTRAREALRDLNAWWAGPFGVRVGAAGLPVEELPSAVNLVVLGPDAGCTVPQAAADGRREVFVEVRTLDEARLAVPAGASALIARGFECGGAVGTATTFVLLQELLGAELRNTAGDPVAIWAAGGIGPHTAAAAVAGGAAGVVLDSQLALVDEVDLSHDVAAAVRRMDGTETAVIGGYRVYVRPDLTRPDADDLPRRIGGRSLAALPVGEDGALARPLAERYRTAAGVVAAIAAGIRAGVSPAAAEAARRPRIAQGPMTRVSDQATFAAAVAAEGGLPFVALALMGAEDTRALLVETADLLGDKPWGVGILGFVPDDVRNAQLEVVHEIRPPYALIAGGRPAQAVPLEAAGITTFLHAPSPALLDRYLAEGARRFVFEGSECGGHVGPRASFPLWEQQISRLLAFGAANNCTDEIDVLFAGGIHDARSAAMVQAAAAPLVAAGGAAGVLMGTAYLFTREAVTAGAIGPAFQRAAVGCASTVLLETAPGHATRCADTAFVSTFNSTRDRLFAEGMPAESVWAELEKLNIGRLRIASKGIRREGAALIPVDERTQARDGMVMIGDVARLRAAVTTIGELHREVTDGAAQFLGERASELAVAEMPTNAAGPLDIAIVGMAGVFPQAGDLAEFWANVLRNHDAITEVPAERWDPATYYNGDGGSGSTSKWGGFLPEVPFDALRYGIPPAALASIEPVQLLSLEVAARALRDAGYDNGMDAARPFDRERAGVVFGAEPGTDLSAAYGFRALYPQLHGELPAELDAQLPALTEDSFPGVLANVISGRIANRLDLGGANYTVDAACASALAALEVACLQLRSGAADMVLTGGADIHNGIQDYLMFASVGALSPSGHCRPFDASADGIALGEGVACVVLKRLADAERDGDRIYAVIAGVGSSSDGRSLGLTAPRPEGQRRALERAYAQAGVSPAQVGLVEAHGTGTVVGDRTELGVLTDVFSAAGATVGSCALGSVKSQIGHTKCTAGLAGLIKAAFAVHTGVLPPTGKITAPNPGWVGEQNPFVFSDTVRPWPARAAAGSELPARAAAGSDLAGPRVAGISAFGFGGTNFHAVLTGWSGAPAPRHGLHQWPVELFLFAGASNADALGEIDRLLALCATNDSAGRPWRLRDLARTTAERSATAAQRSGHTRIAVVATDLDDLAGKLTAARDGRPGDGIFLAGNDSDPASLRSGGELALLFPGQGSQRPGMLADLFAAFPRLADLLVSGAKWASTMFPPSAFDAAGKQAQAAALKDTRVAQPALGIAGLAMFRTLSELGITPAHLAGHSYGELVALAAAGALDPAELLELSEARGRAILAAAGEDPGTMAAVTGSAAEVRAVLNGSGVVVANLNSPTQTVISGPTAAVEQAVGALSAAGLRAQQIPVACAFHSPLVAEASRMLEAELANRTVGSPHLPVWANATAAPYPLGAGAVRELLAEQVVSPVRFAEQIEAMYDAGARVFVECGPGSVLTGLVGAVLGERPHTAIATDSPGRHGVHALLTALAKLAVAGVEVDTAMLYNGRDAHLVSAADAPRAAGWLINGHLVMTADGVPVNGGLKPASRVAPIATAAAETALAPAAAVPTDGREAVVLEFLRNSRELLAAQREVVLGFLGAAPAASIAADSRPAAAAQPAAQNTPAVQAQPVTAAAPAPQPQPVAAPAAVATTPQSVQDLLVELISERTGYPAAMLDVDLDLEADLSIGSLKRTEIIGLLADRMRAAGLDGAPDETKQAELTRIRTLREIVAAICHGPTTAAVPAPAAPVVPAQFLPTRGGPVEDRMPASKTADAEQVRTMLVELIGERTGYPVAMLDADLDLEADLSIGSLKRTEIIGLLADQLAVVRPLDETFQAELTRLRTVRLITERIAGTPATSLPAIAAPSLQPAAEPGPTADRPTVQRYLLEPAAISPAVPTVDLTGRHVTVVSGAAGVVIELCAALEDCGATVRTVSTDPSEELGDVDILVHLGAAGPSEPPSLPDAFAGLRRAVLGGARQLLVATGHGGRFGHRTGIDNGVRSDLPAGLGLAGLMRTIAREYPEISCRTVDLDPKDLPTLLAGHLVTELRNPTGPELVGYATDGRCTLSLVRAPLVAAGRPVSPAELGLSERSVVLLTGGARGITSRVARGLAATAGCHVVLWGRTPLPTDTEDPATAGAADATALRRALIEGGETVPTRVEAEVRRILAEREVRASLAGLREHAASVEYTCVDVRDRGAVADAIAELRQRHGRLDGVVHGAGVLDDRLIADKTSDGFARVWETKVDGARALADALDPDLRFLVLFGSVSGVFGNRGQCDYAAANDALDTLARSWEDRFAGRVLSVDWGPWAPVDGAGDGMVSDELLRSYARQGVAALHPEDGVRALLDELAHGTESQVVYVCAEPSAFDAAFSDGRPAGPC
jgi:acyl transferase domain-containing protein/NAD(P)H-dependent flavin oxidoreductase YrpB (nitropropane dioxygenase family)/NADP-dependent 3-hydroxy acid dehydrogenase YdfG/acyl carrier protein